MSTVRRDASMAHRPSRGASQPSNLRGYNKITELEASQYTFQGVSSCLLVALHACFRFLSDPETMSDPTALMVESLSEGTSYRSEQHLFPKEACQRLPQLRRLLCVHEEQFSLFDGFNMFTQIFFACAGGEPAAAIITKPPESYAVFTTGQDDFYFFDSHGNKIPNIRGASIVKFAGNSGSERFMAFLSAFFPLVAFDDIDMSQALTYNMFDVNIYKLAPSTPEAISPPAAAPEQPVQGDPHVVCPDSAVTDATRQPEPQPSHTGSVECIVVDATNAPSAPVPSSMAQRVEDLELQLHSLRSALQATKDTTLSLESQFVGHTDVVQNLIGTRDEGSAAMAQLGAKYERLQEAVGVLTETTRAQQLTIDALVAKTTSLEETVAAQQRVIQTLQEQLSHFMSLHSSRAVPMATETTSAITTSKPSASSDLPSLPDGSLQGSPITAQLCADAMDDDGGQPDNPESKFMKPCPENGEELTDDWERLG